MILNRVALPAAALTSTAAVVAGITLSPPEDQALWAVRETARVGLIWLLLAFLASPLHTLLKSRLTAGLVASRRRIGLAFALSHTVHLATVIWYVSGHPEWPRNPENWPLIGSGGLAYLFIYMMTFTSNAASRVRLGPWWTRIHTVGIHLLFFIYGFNYVLSVLPHNDVLALLLGPLVLAAYLVRVLAFARRRGWIMRGDAAAA
jgi:DMSO/TMAO reductase YedYZ heme-binding membrane subunit